MPISKIKTSSITADAASINLNIDANTLFLDVANNRVGINTVSPTASLHVYGDAAPAIQIAKSGDVGAGFQLGRDASTLNAFIIQRENADLFIRTNNTERMRILAGGSVGIGTSSPARILEVSTSVPAIALRASGQAVDQKYWEFSVSGTLLRGAVQNDANTTEAFWMEVQRGAGNAVTSVSFPISNVGIGTSAPSSKLEVAGALTLTSVALPTAGTARLYSRNTDNNLYIQTGSGNTLYLLEGSQNTMYAASPTLHSWQISNSEKMRLNNSGQLQVGLNNSSQVGQIQSKGATPTSGTNTYWPLTLSAGATADSGGYTSMIGLGVEGHQWSKGAIGWTRTGSYDRGYIGFYTDNTVDASTVTLADERMRIDNTGNVLIGTTGNIFGSRLAVVGAYPQVAGSFETNNSTYAAISCYTSQGNTPSDQISFYQNVSSTVTLVGKITATTNSVSYGSGSDYRLKNTITPMTGALAKVAQLKPVTFKWNVDGSDGEGFIAHELQTVIPSAVSGEKDETDENGKPRYQNVDTSFLVATLTAAMQEQQALITQLTERIAALENK